MPGGLSSLGGRYLDPGTQVATLLLFLETGSERQRGGRSLARLSLPPTLSRRPPPLLRLGLWDLQTDGAERPGEHQKAAERDWHEPGERAWPPPFPGVWDRGRRGSGFLPTLILTTPFPPSPSRPSLPLQVGFQTPRSGLSWSPASPPPRSLEPLQGLEMNIQRC